MISTKARTIIATLAATLAVAVMPAASQAATIGVSSGMPGSASQATCSGYGELMNYYDNLANQASQRGDTAAADKNTQIVEALHAEGAAAGCWFLPTALAPKPTHGSPKGRPTTPQNASGIQANS